MKLLISIVLFLALSTTACSFFKGTERRVTDSDFRLLDQNPSPNGEFVILDYHYDTGAFGYSRSWWAVVPYNYENLNLIDYELPDGYQAIDWTENNELLIKKWKPYYYIEKEVDLKTGDIFKGVKLRIVEASESESKEQENVQPEKLDSNKQSKRNKNS